MQPLWKKLGFVSAVFCLFVGCNRATQTESSKVSIQIPRQGMSSKGSLHTMTAFPTGRKICYAVNITASDIPAVSDSSCSFPMGLSVGFAEEGQKLELTVPRGENRKIELYTYLQPTGQDSVCPEFSKTLSPQLMQNTYRVAAVGNISTLEPEVTVEMQMDFPGVAQNIATQMALPTMCTMASTRLTGFTVSTAKSKASDVSGSINLYGRVGRIMKATVLTGTGLQLLVTE